MAEEFNSITSQEDFDARVNELYGDVKGLQEQVTTLTGERDTHAATIAQLQGQVKNYQLAELKQRIARQKGIPMEMAARLTGETEKEIAADADTMAGIFRTARGADPSFEPGTGGDSKNADMRSVLQNLRGE